MAYIFCDFWNRGIGIVCDRIELTACHKLLYNVKFYLHYFLVCINLIEKNLAMLLEDNNKKQKEFDTFRGKSDVQKKSEYLN